MDFEFVTDVTGQPLAKCDIESEAFGDWLSHDIGTDRAAITALPRSTPGTERPEPLARPRAESTASTRASKAMSSA